MRLDERGKLCPLPVVEAKKALEATGAGQVVEVVVDNEIAVQNLKKMADHRGLKLKYEKVSDREFLVEIESDGIKKGKGRGAAAGSRAAAGSKAAAGSGAVAVPAAPAAEHPAGENPVTCLPDGCRKGMVVVLSSSRMGQGDKTLGALLMKGFVYALAQQDVLPETVILYNGGAKLSCKDSDSLEDLKSLEAQGTEILTCGTCLNHYGLADQLAVGGVTNMYEIAEKMTGADLLVRP